MLFVIKKYIININYGVNRIKICVITVISVSSHFSKNLTKFPNSYVSVLEGRNLVNVFTYILLKKKNGKLNSEKPIYGKEN